MYLKKTIHYLIVLTILLVLVPLSFAADINSSNLTGKWAIATTEQKCSDTNSEFFTFEPDGTFKARRNNTVEATGFYQVDQGFVYLNFISSIGFFKDLRAELKMYEGSYSQFRVTLLPFNVSDDRFEAFGLLGDQVDKGIAIKCN
jgi:hypothetical protein